MRNCDPAFRDPRSAFEIILAREIEIAGVDGADRFAIVVAEWNRPITDKLVAGCLSTLEAHDVATEAIDIAWVPGAWEIPVVAQRLAQSGTYLAIIALGAVIRGETTHDEHINRGVSLALVEIALSNDLPVLFGVLTCNSTGTSHSPRRRQRRQQRQRVCRGRAENGRIAQKPTRGVK